MLLVAEAPNQRLFSYFSFSASLPMLCWRQNLRSILRCALDCGCGRFVEGDGFAEGSRKVHAKNEHGSDGSEDCEYGGCRVERFSTLQVCYERSTSGSGNVGWKHERYQQDT